MNGNRSGRIRVLVVILPAALFAALAWWLMSGPTPAAPTNDAPLSNLTDTVRDGAGAAVADDNADHRLVPPDNRVAPPVNSQPEPAAGGSGETPDGAWLLRIRDWNADPIGGTLLIWPLAPDGKSQRVEIPASGMVIGRAGAGPIVGLASDGGIVSCTHANNLRPDGRTLWLDAAEPGCGWIDDALRGAIADGSADPMDGWPLQALVRVIDESGATVNDACVDLTVDTVSPEPPGLTSRVKAKNVVVHAEPVPIARAGARSWLEPVVATGFSADRTRLSERQVLGGGLNTLLLGDEAQLKLRLVDTNGRAYAHTRFLFDPHLENLVPFNDTVRQLLIRSMKDQVHVLRGRYSTDADGVIDLGRVPAGKWGVLPPRVVDAGDGTLQPSSVQDDEWLQLLDVPAGEHTFDIPIRRCAILEVDFVSPRGRPLTPDGDVAMALFQPEFDEDLDNFPTWKALQGAAPVDRGAFLTDRDLAKALTEERDRVGVAMHKSRDLFTARMTDGSDPMPGWTNAVFDRSNGRSIRVAVDLSGAWSLIVTFGGCLVPVGPIQLAVGEVTHVTAVVVQPWDLTDDGLAPVAQIIVRPIATSPGLRWSLRSLPGNDELEAGTIDDDGTVRLGKLSSDGDYRLVVFWPTPAGPGGVMPCDFHLAPDRESPDAHVTDLAGPSTVRIAASDRTTPDPRIDERLSLPGPAVNFDGTPLEEAVSQVARSIGMRMRMTDAMRAAGYEDEELSISLGSGLPARICLNLISDLLDLAWTTRGDEIVLMPVAEAALGDYGGPHLTLIDSRGERHTIDLFGRSEVVVAPGPCEVLCDGSASGSRLWFNAPPGQLTVQEIGPLCNVVADRVVQLAPDGREIELERQSGFPEPLAAQLLPGRYRAIVNGVAHELRLPDDAAPAEPGHLRVWRVVE